MGRDGMEQADSLTFDQKVSAVTLSVHQQQPDLHWMSVISSSGLCFQVFSPRNESYEPIEWK